MAGLPQQMTLVGEKMVFILDSHRWERGLFVVGAPAALLVFCLPCVKTLFLSVRPRTCLVFPFLSPVFLPFYRL